MAELDKIDAHYRNVPPCSTTCLMPCRSSHSSSSHSARSNFKCSTSPQQIAGSVLVVRRPCLADVDGREACVYSASSACHNAQELCAPLLLCCSNCRRSA